MLLQFLLNGIKGTVSMYGRAGAKLHKIATTFFYLPIIFLLERISRILPVQTGTFWGDRMNALLPEGLSLNVVLFGYTERDLSSALVSLLKNGMTFIDVGAHYGYFTMLASSLVGAEGGVYSFEPTPSSFGMLLRNIQNRKNVHPNKAACFSRSGKMALQDFGTRYSAYNTLAESRLGIVPTGKKTEVTAIRLDDYVAKQKIKPDFVKIDAETSEFEVLKGMERVISTFHPVISVEVGDYVKGAPRSSEVLEFLLKKGYVAYEHKDGKWNRHSVRKTYTFGTIILSPNWPEPSQKDDTISRRET